MNTTTKTFQELSEEDLGTTFTFHAKVEVIKQTGGPTLMILSDGTANFTFKAFLRPGARAYPEIELGDSVEVTAEVTRRKEGIEGEVKNMKKLSGEEHKSLSKGMDKLNEERYKATADSFTIKSDMLESQKDRFIQVAQIIRRAVAEGRPILLRHNADCDGYSSAITIERAILKFMDEVSGGDKLLQYQNYRRAPSKAPFYEYEDAVKDLGYWLRDKIKNGAKEPLIIITDNGSTDEDVLAMKQMLLYNAQIVVVDHHFPGEITDGKVEVDKYIDAHINPYLTGFNSNVCTGMLGYELARFIHEEPENSIFIPAMSGILDHCEGPEIEKYVELAKKEGFSEEYLTTLGEIVDMQSHYIRFNESREFIEELYGNETTQKAMVEMLGPELERRYKAVEKVAKHYATKEDFGAFYLVSFDGEKGTYRGEYPAIGKSTNHIHRTFCNELDKPVVTMTFGSTFMTIRAHDDVPGISVPEFAKSIIEKMPHTNADGGGHERAGSVKFVEYAREDIINLFKDYLKGLK
jgi:RecJ-like exonuclease